MVVPVVEEEQTETPVPQAAQFVVGAAVIAWKNPELQVAQELMLGVVQTEQDEQPDRQVVVLIDVGADPWPAAKRMRETPKIAIKDFILFFVELI